MSVRNVQPAEHNMLPTISLEEARSKGLNVAKVPTCAVTMRGASGEYIAKGCPKGKHCAQSGFGSARFGAFGPKSPDAGSSGTGAENVPYYHYDIGSSTEVEGFMPCFIFMQTMMDKYESQRRTGDILEILGREGKCSITILETLPSDMNGNANGSKTHMVERAKTIEVPRFKTTDGKSVRMEYALKIRENRDRTEAAENRTRMAPTVAEHFGDADGAGDVENVLEVPEGLVDAGEAAAMDPDALLAGIENSPIPPSGRRVGRINRS